MIHVVAIITAKPGLRDKVLAEAKANVPNVLAEQGCLEYAPATDAEGFGSFQTKFGPDTLVFIEKWENAEALKLHSSTPHMQAYSAKTKDLVANRIIHIISD